MNVLAFDTATEILSVALQTSVNPEHRRPNSGEPLPLHRIRTQTQDNGLKHSRTLVPLIAELVLDAGMLPEHLDLIACTRGPGSFTGLRIGMATAKGLAAAIAASRGMPEPPMISIPTLDVMAAALPADGSVVLPVIDGRKGRFYTAIFRSQNRQTADLDLAPAEIMQRVAQIIARRGAASLPDEDSILITGPHADRFVSRLQDASGLILDPGFRRGHAVNLISLAVAEYDKHGPDAEGQGPIYIRESDAELSQRRG